MFCIFNNHKVAIGLACIPIEGDYRERNSLFHVEEIAGHLKFGVNSDIFISTSSLQLNSDKLFKIVNGEGGQVATHFKGLIHISIGLMHAEFA